MCAASTEAVARREEIHEEAERRARADLERLEVPGARTGKNGPEDTVDRWGRLIGRALGVLFLVYLVYWLSTKIL